MAVKVELRIGEDFGEVYSVELPRLCLVKGADPHVADPLSLHVFVDHVSG